MSVAHECDPLLFKPHRVKAASKMPKVSNFLNVDLLVLIMSFINSTSISPPAPSQAALDSKIQPLVTATVAERERERDVL